MRVSGLRSYLQCRIAGWIRRRQGPDLLPVTLQGRRIYILPTRAGAGFALLLLFMFIAGLNYANSLALFLTFLLAGFGLVAMHQCHRNLLGTCLQEASTHPTFARTAGKLQLTLTSPGPAPRYGIEAGLQTKATAVTDLLPGISRRLDLTVAAPARGLVRIERFKLTSVHPFGLFRAWTWVHAPLAMTVYPRPQGALPMPGQSDSSSGQRAGGSLGADEWLGLRPFRDGDSPRQVDWKAYAREAPLLVKEYRAAAAPLRQLRMDQVATLSCEAALEQLARWVVDAETRGDRYGLELPAVHLKPDRGPEHRHRCLAALAMYQPRS